MSAWTKTRSLLPWITLAAAVVIATFVFADSPIAPARPRGAERIARGQYLIKTIGCGDCHSPKIMGPAGPVEDESRLLSGHPESAVLDAPPALNGSWMAATSTDLTAWVGPWGISYTFNLTPDENTGIGSWSEDTFVQAIKTGRHMGIARPILPPMPWHFYRNLTDEDLRSIYAFLRTIPPVHNRVPLPTPPEQVAAATASK